MIHINNENFSNFVETLTKYTLQSIKELNEYFDADEVFYRLNLVKNFYDPNLDNVNKKRSRGNIAILKECIHKHLSTFNITVDYVTYRDKELHLIVNICTQYLEGKIELE